LDLEHIRPSMEKDLVDLKATYCIDENIPVICGIFRLSPEKRPLFFLEIIARLKQQLENLRVILVGEGTLRLQIKTRIKELQLEDTVILAGRKSDVAAILSLSTLLLHTSFLEGTPNVVLEAQYLGVPVVVTAGGGAAEAVENGVTGYVKDNNDKNGLVSACIDLLTDQEKYRAFSKAGPVFVEQKYSLQQMVDVMEGLYQWPS